MLLHGRDEARACEKLAGYGVEVPGARFTTRYEDLLESPDVDIVSITTPGRRMPGRRPVGGEGGPAGTVAADPLG